MIKDILETYAKFRRYEQEREEESAAYQSWLSEKLTYRDYADERRSESWSPWIDFTFCDWE